MISHHEALFRVRHPQVIKNWYPGCQTIQEINTSRGQVRVERLFVGHVMLIYTRWVSSVLAECLARFELAGTSSARWTELTKTSTRDKMETDILKCKYSVVVNCLRFNLLSIVWSFNSASLHFIKSYWKWCAWFPFTPLTWNHTSSGVTLTHYIEKCSVHIFCYLPWSSSSTGKVIFKQC